MEKTKENKYSLAGEWINKLYYIYSMEYRSAIESNEIQLFLATSMNLKSTRLSKRSQIHIQTTYCMIIFMLHSHKGKTTGRRTALPGNGAKDRELTMKGNMGTPWCDRKILYLDNLIVKEVTKLCAL